MPSAPDSPNTNLIFVSIASYRDEQLVPTVLDCIAKAHYPERLRFGICWQHDASEPALPFAADERFRILDVDYRESKGACWARSEIMKLWNGEDWFLQTDSHCRFAPFWDEFMIHAAGLTGSPKPILSTYATAFAPASATTREVLAGFPQLMAISTFNPEGLPHLKPVEMPKWQLRKAPVRARFLAAGFLFTRGEFVREVGYDPKLYFFGEEIAMTLRAFTNGYDLFHPNHVLVWHDYVRSYAPRHWDDHTEEKATVAWKEIDSISRERVVSLLKGVTGGEYGLGTVRTLGDYETYAGISFALKKIQDYTLRTLEPPNPEPSPTWTDEIYTWLVRILIDPTRLSPAAFEDPAFWYVAIQDEDRNEIHRRDFPPTELAAFTGKEPKIALVCEMQSGIIPVYWTLWPVSKKFGWLSKTEGKLLDDDYAIIQDGENDGETEEDPADPNASAADDSVRKKRGPE